MKARDTRLVSGFAMLAVLCGAALAEPVVTIERADGRKVVTELVALSEGQFWIRALDAEQLTDTIPADQVKAIDFGTLSIELNARGAMLLPDKPEATTRLWWAIDSRQFVVLLRTCRQDSGTARLLTVLKVTKEVEEALKKTGISAERRRDLLLARVVLLSAQGRRERVRQELNQLRGQYPDDPVVRRFAADINILLRQEWQRRPNRNPGARPGAGRRTPPDAGRGTRNDAD